MELFRHREKRAEAKSEQQQQPICRALVEHINTLPGQFLISLNLAGCGFSEGSADEQSGITQKTKEFGEFFDRLKKNANELTLGQKDCEFFKTNIAEAKSYNFYQQHPSHGISLEWQEEYERLCDAFSLQLDTHEPEPASRCCAVM